MSLKILKSCAEEKKHGCNVSSIICHKELIVTGSDDGKIKVWKPSLDLVSEMEAPAGILSLAACENVLYTSATDGNIHSWDLNTSKNLGVLSSSLYLPQRLSVDQSSKVLWAGDKEGNVGKFEGGKEVKKFELVEEAWDLIVIGNTVYAARDRDVVIAEVDCDSHIPRTVTKSTFQGRSPICITGNYFCFLNRDGRNIHFHENSIEKKFSKVKEIVGSELIINALASVSENVLFSGGYDSTVKQWDLKNWNCKGSVNLGCCINALVCKTENEVYVARSDGLVTKIGI